MRPVLQLIGLVLALSLMGCDVRRLRVDGFSRRYLLHTPSDYDGSQPLPLVIAVHGRLGTARSMARSSGFDELVDQAGFIVVYPDGYRRSWADGRGGSPAEEAGVDDVAYFDALLEAVADDVSVDPERVYIAGISNGGMMAQRLACERTERFAAVASIISAMPEAVHLDCAPTAPLSMLLMNGTEDPLVPYEGGEVDSDNQGVVLSTDATIAYWVDHNACTGDPDEWDLDEVDDGTSIHHQRWASCQSGVAVELYQVIGGGHTWPSGPQYVKEERIGIVSQELVAAEVIWEFFEPLVRD